MAKNRKKVRVAIIGVGNCANALIQGVHYYKNAADDEEIPGLMHATVGGYHVRDIEFSAEKHCWHSSQGSIPPDCGAGHSITMHRLSMPSDWSSKTSWQRSMREPCSGRAVR